MRPGYELCPDCRTLVAGLSMDNHMRGPCGRTLAFVEAQFEAKPAPKFRTDWGPYEW